VAGALRSEVLTGVEATTVASLIQRRQTRWYSQAMWTARAAIEEAERVLPGQAAPEKEVDVRWQAIIRVAEFTTTDPDELWQFARKWGASDDADLRQAIGSCLLEHLLQFHFDVIFPRVEVAVREDARFAETFLGCWEFGQTEEPENQRRFRALRVELRKRR
jgi:hypothetical protein